MILVWLIVILLVAGILAWWTARWSTQLPRWISLVGASIDFILALALWARHSAQVQFLPQNTWFDQVDCDLDPSTRHPFPPGG